MKQNMRYIIISIFAIFLITGCSKQPLQEINAARSAVDSVISEGAEKYLPEDAKKINDAFNKAMDEVKAQDAKIFKNFDKAKEMLAAVKTEAGVIAANLTVKKEEAKKDAIAAIEDAKTLLDTTKELLEKNSGRKGSKAANESILAEVKNLESSFKELQLLVEREDYLMAISQAGEIRNKASELSTFIQQSYTKTEKKKK
jgi:ABC-type transporter Mla subunit MlaD